MSRDPARDAGDTSREGARYRARDDAAAGPVASREVALLADTFNAAFEPENLHDTLALLGGLGYRVSVLSSRENGRALCCGRTFLSAGLVEEARAEARRLLAVALPFVARGVPVVGLEPSCLFTLRDEFCAMLPGSETERLASHALLLEEFLVREADAGRIPQHIARSEGSVLLHGHCHQKAFGAMDAVRGALGLVAGLRVETVESSCCGMAGAFGYGADTYATLHGHGRAGAAAGRAQGCSRCHHRR